MSSNWQINQLKYAFGLGGLFSFYGIVAFITWQLPMGTSSRVVVIALVLLTLPIALIMMYVSSRRQKKKEQAEAEAAEGDAGEGSEAAKPKKEAAPAISAELSGGIEETVQFLKSSNLGEGGKDAIYSLPWY